MFDIKKLMMILGTWVCFSGSSSFASKHELNGGMESPQPTKIKRQKKTPQTPLRKKRPQNKTYNSPVVPDLFGTLKESKKGKTSTGASVKPYTTLESVREGFAVFDSSCNGFEFEERIDLAGFDSATIYFVSQPGAKTPLYVIKDYGSYNPTTHKSLESYVKHYQELLLVSPIGFPQVRHIIADEENSRLLSLMTFCGTESLEAFLSCNSNDSFLPQTLLKFGIGLGGLHKSGISKKVKKPTLENLKTKHTHGDLSLENIRFEKGTFYLIDIEGMGKSLKSPSPIQADLEGFVQSFKTQEQFQNETLEALLESFFKGYAEGLRIVDITPDYLKTQLLNW